MKELRFDTGLVSYKLNDSVEVAFNPTDVAFTERLFNVFNELDKKQSEYDAEKTANMDARQFFDTARRLDEEMRGMIDEVFGQPVCAALFGGMNVYAFADGLPVWCNLMFAIMDEIDGSVVREKTALNPRIQKYTAKYHK